MFKYVVFGLLVASAIATPAPSSGLDCEHVEDALTCLAVKATATLERAARSADINLIDGVTLVRDTPVERTGKALKSESEIMSELPADSTQKAMAVATMMYDNAAKLVESHSLKVDMSEGRTHDDNIFSLSSTKKYKKMLSPLMTLIGVKLFALAPVFLGGLALFVTKAIFLSKVAILIAGVLLYQKFFGAGSRIAGGFPTDFFAKNNVAPQYYNDQVNYAQNLAYSAQAPAQ